MRREIHDSVRFTDIHVTYYDFHGSDGILRRCRICEWYEVITYGYGGKQKVFSNHCGRKICRVKFI